MLDVLVIITASAIAAVIDAFTGEIPEWLTIPLIVLGLIYSFYAHFFWTALAAAVGTLIVGYLLYYTGQLGGGDVLLLAGISAWKPMVGFLPSALVILILGLILSSIFFSVYYSLFLWRKTSKKKFLFLSLPYILLPPAFAAVYGSIITAFLGQKYREELFVREKPISDVAPEDVLAEDVQGLPPGKKVLERKDIERLRETGVKTVKVLDNLPRFGPFIFLALLLVLSFETNTIDLYNYTLSLLSAHIKLYP